MVILITLIIYYLLLVGYSAVLHLYDLKPKGNNMDFHLGEKKTEYEKLHEPKDYFDKFEPFLYGFLTGTFFAGLTIYLIQNAN